MYYLSSSYEKWESDYLDPIEWVDNVDPEDAVRDEIEGAILAEKCDLLAYIEEYHIDNVEMLQAEIEGAKKRALNIPLDYEHLYPEYEKILNDFGKQLFQVLPVKYPSRYALCIYYGETGDFCVWGKYTNPAKARQAQEQHNAMTGYNWHNDYIIVGID